ncbi:hypothetical protein SDC9_108889 [bioreactor metagenome]|uniref:Uncharacterized protein n=1 Tax=bioreactor metagenome TaxID=1076179 RepID=A0A645BJT2_9ZZZZ
MLPLAKSKYIKLLAEEIENNGKAFLGIFDYKKLDDITINGNKIKIK